jgi:hypothetical protein
VAYELTTIEGWNVAMSNNYWDEEDDDLDTQEQFPSDGSDLLKKLRKAKRADEKRIKELTEQLESLSKVQRERLVNEVLEKKGVNKKAARLVMKDLDDVNEESVSRWLDDNADLFGLQVTDNAPNPNDLAALRQQDLLTQGAITPEQGMNLDQRLAQAQSPDEILSILRSQ